MTTTRRRPITLRTSSRYHLLEGSPASRPERRVDPDRGIIYGVKVLGPQSNNGREYSPDCIRKAVRLYEGALVNADHPDDPEDQRSIRDRLGLFRNARFHGDSIYADLHLIKSHPLTKSILESAINPDLHSVWGFSHNADGDVEVIDGKPVVTRIFEVRSVDLVSSPATTKGLFESIQPSNTRTNRKRVIRSKQKRGKTMKLREWFDRTKLLKPVRRTLKRLMEGGYMDPDAEMALAEADEMDVENSAGGEPTSDPADMEPEEALRQGFRAAMVAVIDDTTMPVKDKVTRLKKLLATAEDLLSSGQEIPEQEDEDLADADLEEGDLTISHEDEDEDADLMEEGDYPEDDEILEADCDAEDGDLKEGEGCTSDAKESDNPFTKPAPKVPGTIKASVKESKQSLLKKIRRANALLEARALCDARGVRPTVAILEALVRLPRKGRPALLEQFRTPSRRKAKTASYDPFNLTPGNTDTGAGSKDLDNFVKAITKE